MNEKNTIQKLVDFVNQRPGLESGNYGGCREAYYSDRYQITKAKNDFFKKLSKLQLKYSYSEMNIVLTKVLSESKDRLCLVGDNLEYTTGQYFPTEYRWAACRILDYAENYLKIMNK